MILPVDPAEIQIEIDAVDAMRVVQAVESLMLRGEADVYVAGAYQFSIRPNDGGIWIVFDRDEDYELIGAFG